MKPNTTQTILKCLLMKMHVFKTKTIIYPQSANHRDLTTVEDYRMLIVEDRNLVTIEIYHLVVEVYLYYSHLP